MAIGTNIYQDIISFDFSELKKEVNTNNGDIIIAYIEEVAISVFRHPSIRNHTTFGSPIGTPYGCRNNKTGEIDIHLNIPPKLLMTNMAQRAIRTQAKYLNNELRYIEFPRDLGLLADFNRIIDLILDSDSIVKLNTFPDGVVSIPILDCVALEEQQMEFGLFKNGRNLYRGSDPTIVIDMKVFAPMKTIKYLESMFPYIKLTLLEYGFVARTDDIFIKDYITLKFNSGKIFFLVDEFAVIKERNMTMEEYTSAEELVLTMLRTLSKKIGFQ